MSEKTAPWPDDVPFARSRSVQIGEGSPVTVGALRMSAHLGTHADAPAHFERDGWTTDQLPLRAFCGPAHVVAVSDEAIRPSHVADLDLSVAPRVLFRTRASDVPPDVWSANFPPVLPETVERLAGEGAVLVGTDAPSVDPADSQKLEAHHALSRCGLCNLENLALAGVAPGQYMLFAPPLRLLGMDAAPARAVLMSLPDPVRRAGEDS